MPSNTLKTGTLLQGGKYRIIKVLGQGGFGITYLAEQKVLGRVAIKEFFMRDYCTRDETSRSYTLTQADMVERYRQKFIKEVKLIAKQKHSGIVKVSDFFEENGNVYYVMEYIEGESLADIIHRRGALPEQNALNYISKVAEALNYLHQSNVNHLDIKPSNIMVRREDDMPILIDFGVSKQYDEYKDETTSTPPGVSDGYSPIEQYQSGGVSTFSPQADIYALGATLYTLLTGETPPKASFVLNNGLPPLPDNISDWVRKAIENAMTPQAHARPKSVKEFINMLGKGKSRCNGIKGLFKWCHKKPHADNVTLKLPSNEREETRPVSSGGGVDIPPTTPSRLWKWWLIGGLLLIGCFILLLSLFRQDHGETSIHSTANEEVITSDSVEIQWQVFDCKYLGEFQEGLATVQDESGKYGYVDKAGNVVIPCQWKGAAGFSEGLARVKNDNDKYGFIDKTGYKVISCKWKDAEGFYEGLARVKDDEDKWGFIDKAGTEVIPCKWKSAEGFYEGLARVKDNNDKWGFIDKVGTEVIPCKWKSVNSFYEGLARVENDEDKWGIIDKAGTEVIPCQWKYVYSFQEGLARVKDDNDKYGFIDKTGYKVISCKWKDAEGFSEGVAKVKDDNGKWGFIDKAGYVVIPCKWKSAEGFSEGLAKVKDDNDKWGFIDKAGTEVIPCQWKVVYSFNEGLAKVKDDNDKYGFIDKIGNVVFRCQWQDVYSFHEGLARVEDDKGNYHFITKTGEIIDIKKPAN